MSYVFTQKNSTLPPELVQIIFKYKTILAKIPHPMSQYIKQLQIHWHGIDRYFIKPDLFVITYTIPKHSLCFFIHSDTHKKIYKIEKYKIKNIYEILSTITNNTDY